MQLKEESFIGVDNHFENFNFFYKNFYENGLLKSESTLGVFSEFEYTEDGKIIVEKITQDNGGGEYFFRREYKYEELTTRIFHYKTGYSNLRDQFVPDEIYSNLSKPRDGSLPIYPVNELLSIEEIFYNKSKEMISIKKTDLKNNSFLEEKKCSDNNGNLINCKSKYNYNDNVLESILVDNALSNLKYNDDGMIIEIECFEIVENLEVFYSRTILRYSQNRCVSVNFKASDKNDFRFNDELGFFGWEKLFEKESKSLLKLSCILDSDYDYYQKNYEVKILYDNNNEIIQTNVLNTKNICKMVLDSTGVEDTIFYDVEIEEKRFFFYKYDEKLLMKNNPIDIIHNNHPIEYIDGFTIKNNQIEHLFTHKFAYFD